MVEIRLEVLYDEINQDNSRVSDGIIRDIQRRLGNETVWEKYNNGWRAMA